MGVKESILVERDGGPLSVCVAGANVNDHLLLAATLDAIVVERPQPTEEEPQHLSTFAWTRAMTMSQHGKS